MKLVVISPESAEPREPTVLAQLFAAGLTSYHVRKPSWSRDQLAAYLCALPAEFLPRLVLHTHNDLANEFPVAGLHDRDTPNPICHVISDKYAGVGRVVFRSRAVHDLNGLRASLDTYDRVLLSPVFPSFSKPGYGPSVDFSHDALRPLLALPRRAEVVALGGIDASRISACRDLGFDGVAVIGAIWQASDPLRAFRELQNALHAHAA